MRVDLIKCILHILQKNHQVALPGLGSLRVVNKNASISDNQIYPPQQSIIFDDKIENIENFISYISESYGLSAANAELVLKKFSHRLINRIANYNEVLLPKIGLLKSIGNKSINLIEDENTINFTKNYLPVLELKEIVTLADPKYVASTSISSVNIDTKILESNSVEESKNESSVIPEVVLEDTEVSLFEKYLWPLLALLILIIALIFGIRTCNKDTPPIVNDNLTTTLSDSLDEEKILQQELINEFDTNRIYTEEELALIPNEIYELGCVIIVGAFSNEGNVDKMVNKIEEMGYVSFTELNDNGLMRVGILFDCVDIDLIEFIQIIRTDIEKEAWYLQPHLHVNY